MDLTLSSEQEQLQDAVTSVCAGHFTSEQVRALHGSGVDRTSWRALADMGVFALRLPEDAGGAGLGTAEAALALERLGKSLVPGPLVASVLAAGLVDGVADGTVVAGLVERDDPLLVEYLGALDVLLVLDDDGVVAVDRADVVGEPVPSPADPLTPIHHVTSVPAGRVVGGGPELAAQWRLEGAVLTAALQVGLAQLALDLATAYARQREQFGKPIGQFQAVKHLLADSLARVELARSAVYAAAVTLDDPEVGDVRRRASAAKLVADEAAVGNGRTGVQVHGGMGFTWEVDAHLPLRRAWVLATHFGSVDDHAELMAEMI